MVHSPEAMEETTDRDLITRYAASRDEAAFAALVARHSAMVYRVCRALAGETDAEDCAQAVFLVLARKARSLRRSGSLAAWLYGVARHVSMRAVRDRSLRLRRERGAGAMRESVAEDTGASDARAPAIGDVYARLGSLSAVQREAIVLRYLEGCSEKDAAQIAGCSVAALSRRAADGIAKLRARLARRVGAVSIAALVSLLESEAQAAVPATLLPSIVAASSAAATGAAAGAVSGGATALAEGAMKMMIVAKVKAAALVAATVVTVFAGTGYAVDAALRQSVPPGTTIGASPTVAPVVSAALSAKSSFVRPDVDPRLAANLARTIRVRTTGPSSFQPLFEQIIRALPPYESLTARIFPGFSLTAWPHPKSPSGREIARRFHRPVSLTSAETTLREILDDIGRQLNLRWIAAGDEIVFYAVFGDDEHGSVLGAFGQRGEAEEVRRRSAEAIVSIWHPPGVKRLVLALHDANDPAGARIARSVLGGRGCSYLLADDGLAVAVRALMTADEIARAGKAELAHFTRSGNPYPTTLSMRLFGFLRVREAVRILGKTLAQYKDLGGLLAVIAKATKTGRGPQEARSIAAHALGAIGGKEAVDALLAALTVETKQSVRSAIITAVGETRDPRCVEPLVAFLDAQKGNNHLVHERSAAVGALGLIGGAKARDGVLCALASVDDYASNWLAPSAPEALARLVDETTRKQVVRLMREARHECVRISAADALALCRDPATVPALLDVMEHASRNDWIVRQSAGRALARIGDTGSFKELERIALTHRREDVFRAAAVVLAQARDPAASRALLNAFRKAKGSNRIWQIGNWLALCHEGADQDLLEIVKSDANHTRRRLAASAFGRHGGSHAWRTLIELYENEQDTGARCGMLEGMAMHARPEVRDVLLKATAGDPDAKLRRTAAGLVVQFARDDERTLNALLKTLKSDASADVRSSAGYALSKLLEERPGGRTMVTASATITIGTQTRSAKAAPAEAPRVDALRRRVLDALLAAAVDDPSPDVRHMVPNTLHSTVGSVQHPYYARTRDVFLGALKTERDALVQRVLLSFFFMKMKDDPSLAGAMIEILNDPAHPKRMRDQACQNLEVIGRPTRAVRNAIEEYKKGRAGGGAERAPQEVF